MSESAVTVSRKPAFTADARPRTGANTYVYALSFLLVIGCVTDVQGVALLPLLGKMEAALHLSAAETAWALNSLSIATAVAVGLSASSFPLLLVGRIVLGLCVCAPMSWAMLKIRSNPQGMERAALWNGTLISIMTPLGLILGGILLDLGASWSSFFWIVAAGYVILLVQVLFMPETPRKDRVNVPLDWAGSLGLGAWLVCFLLALSFGESWGWDSASIIGLFAGGAVILAAWIIHQRFAKHALMDFKGMDVRQVAAGYSIYCTVAITASGLYILEPGLAQTPGVAGYGFGATVLRSSLALLPILPASFVAAAISKPMLARLGPRPPIALGGVMCVVAFALMAFWHSSLWEFYVEVAIYGVGIIIAFNVGWALTASAGRQDNMSTTFGIQYAIALPAAAIITAVILAVMEANVKVVPALGGIAVPKEGSYTGLFLMLAGVSLVGYVINGLFIVPRRLRHQTSRLEEVVASASVVETGSAGV